MMAQGTLYLSHTKPLATTAKDGTYQLTLLAFNRIGPHRIELWHITYSGPAALAWFTDYGTGLCAGQAIRVELKNLRKYTIGSRSGWPEFVCDVISVELLSSNAKTPSNPYTSCVTSY